MADGTTLKRYRMKRAMLLWWKAQMQLAATYPKPGKTGPSSVALVPAGLNLDTVHNMDRESFAVNARNPAVKVLRTVNGVHPAMPGQGQIADAFWAWLKYESR